MENFLISFLHARWSLTIYTRVWHTRWPKDRIFAATHGDMPDNPISQNGIIPSMAPVILLVIKSSIAFDYRSPIDHSMDWNKDYMDWAR